MDINPGYFFIIEFRKGTLREEKKHILEGKPFK